MNTGDNVKAAVDKVVETGKTKAGRLGYIAIFILGILVGGGLIFWLKG